LITTGFSSSSAHVILKRDWRLLPWFG